MVKKLTICLALEPFLSKPNEKLHLADISRELRESHSTVRQWLNALEREGALRKEYKGRLTLYSLNLQNQNLIDYLVISEKNKLIRRCREHLALAEIVSNLSITATDKMLIFGSAAESFNSAKDIDLLIVGKQVTASISNLANRLNKKLHIIKVDNLRKISKTLKSEIIKKHLLINGSEDFLRWMIWQQ